MFTYVFRNKIKSALCIVTLANVTRVIPKRSMLELLLFNISINGKFLFIEKSDVCKFDGNSTLFSCGDNLSEILKRLEHDMKNLLRWFKFIYSDSGKVSIYDPSEILTVKYCLTIGPINVKEWDHVELLGITIDKHFDFKKNIENLCWNANYKLHGLRRMTKYLAVEKAKLLGNTSINRQFTSASLI